MICSLCTNTALRIVGTKGFCKAHTSEAFQAALTEHKTRLSESAISKYLNPDELERRRWQHQQENTIGGWR